MDSKQYHRITSTIVGARSQQELFEQTGKILTKLLCSHRWSIMLKTDFDLIRISMAKGIPEKIVSQTVIKRGEGIAGRIFDQGYGGLFVDIAQDLGMSSGGSYRTTSAICVPIIYQGDVLGVLNISEKRVDGQSVDFDADDLAIACIIANQLALMMKVVLSDPSLANSAVTADTVVSTPTQKSLYAHASAFDLLSRVIDMMTGNTSLDQVLSSAINGASKLLGATRVSLMLLESKGSEMRIRAAVGIKKEIADQVRVALGSGIAGKVAKTGVPQLLKNPRAARIGKNDHLDPEKRKYQVNSALSVPLKIQGKILGVMNINDPSDGEDFTDNDLNIATIIAGQAAVAISTTELLEESVAAAEIRRSMIVATEIQNHLLPSQLQQAGVDIAGSSDTCDEAGGDYIDYFLSETPDQISSKPVYICCGDVSGHGIGAALIMAMGRAFLRALVQQNDKLENMMFKLNNLIESDTPPEQFMTLFLIQIDPVQQQLNYCSAGHEPGLLYRHRTGEFLELKATGLPLGMFDEQDYTVSSLGLEKDDLLILSTDGLSEAENMQGEQFGRKRLQDIVKQSAQDSPGEIINTIKQSLLAFTQAKPLHDDLSIIIARIRFKP